MGRAGRPRIYATEEERIAAKRIRDLQSWHRRKKQKPRQTMPGPVNPNCEEIVRPPPEVLLERDFRYEQISTMTATDVMMSQLPSSYAGAYYQMAWRFQRYFARR